LNIKRKEPTVKRVEKYLNIACSKIDKKYNHRLRLNVHKFSRTNAQRIETAHSLRQMKLVGCTILIFEGLFYFFQMYNHYICSIKHPCRVITGYCMMYSGWPKKK